MTNHNTVYFLNTILKKIPNAYAYVTGSKKYSMVHGIIRFYSVVGGTLIVSEVDGLPSDSTNCPADIFAFHIHEGGDCEGDESDPFAAAGSHYNPTDCPHPAHAGDLIPLFGNRGFSWSVFFTSRFQPEEVVGKTVIVHSGTDDFTTQPSGNAGEKIACGEIRGLKMEPI
jgi:Cu-Zn family superoxide dismutase